MVANYISDQQPSIANTSLSTADTMLLRPFKKKAHVYQYQTKQKQTPKIALISFVDP